MNEKFEELLRTCARPDPMRASRHFAVLLALVSAVLLPQPSLGEETTPTAGPAKEAATPVTILDLPFKVSAMRGPRSEVALSASTSGLLPIARPKPASADPKAAPPREPDPAQIVVVWGDGGGAILGLVDGTLRTTLLGAEAVTGLLASETPRGAVPGSRRALDGPLSAYLSGPTRGTHAGSGQAAGLTIRERQPVVRSADPKPVPIVTETVTPGTDASFARRTPHIVTIDGKHVVLAITSNAQAASSLAVVEKDGEGHWRIRARTPAPTGEQSSAAVLSVAAVADFIGTGQPQVAVVRASGGAGPLQLWSYSEGTLKLVEEMAGFAGPTDTDVEFAAAVPNEPGESADLAIPAADRTTLLILTLKGGFRERSRTPLPAPAALGIAALGSGSQARLLVGLADGRIAVIPTYQGARP